MEDNKDIYNMTLHERVYYDRHRYVERVPGGWIYRRTTENSPVFVPYSSEFYDKELYNNIVEDDDF